MTGPGPADATKWTTLCDLVANAEKLALYNTSTIVQAVGYQAGSEVADFSKVYALTGSLSPTGLQVQQGEVCALVRYSTANRSTKNHPIYLFNYYHDACSISASQRDQPHATWVAALNTYAQAWISGFNDGANVQVRCSPQGHIATTRVTEGYLTHRDFPRD